MEGEWRRVFAKKLEAIFALNPHMIFVSETTQDSLRKLFPRFTPRSENVIYPTIRQDLTAAATRVSKRGPELVATAHARGPKQGAGKGPVTGYVTAPRPAPAFPWNPRLPYFATALSNERRKNVSLIVDAFARLSGTANMAIVGQIDVDRYFDPAISLPSNVCVMGYLSEADKADVIQASAGVIFPSLSEGFGIPIVEGAVLGVPVLCSDIPVFREVAGPSALYFDPMDAGSLVAAVTQAIAEPDAQRARAADLQTAVLQRFSQAAMSQRVAATLAKAGLRLEVAPTEPVDAGPSRGPVSIAS
jgi:glycosyltransferase involved in cell wall biosynthesis